jgi:hypothetical protein
LPCSAASPGEFLPRRMDTLSAGCEQSRGSVISDLGDWIELRCANDNDSAKDTPGGGCRA